MIILIAIILALYFKNENDVNMNNYIANNQQNIESSSNDDNDVSEIKEIPENYYEVANEQGKLEEFYYNTYESKTYEQKSKQLRKRAIVYTPYGYDESKEYDIFYLMHGG